MAKTIEDTKDGDFSV